ncbi:DNA-binding MurR/RpiR family transcriptional regulator [Amycolatopsis bartoniae]|uniref:Transcriptional regulator n=1 Tax=Amycolatopsis bartoniae TaxID=941986 RepID=A0A8H9IQ86_9PSEU|nr:MurR/RpiR family transcriptional regulator [Amycolatopsis bartoniae]MBB2934870.1 DNA-binding MurR/RpiR family transcriptional regulator [Amycolatopsis bartoniae]TVT00756.1 MurR/RpiR family transcriptional regulator [Amycolatopsis bartoniae]GHF44190.1 transcriptional regulator [Amycolatopsis bartoniae]
MTPPGSYQELTELLRGRLPKLAAGQRRIAHLVLADPEGTAHRGITEAARLVEVNESSITRFANSLGLSGYPDLMELCRVWLAEQAQVARRTDEPVEPPGGLLSATLEQEQTNLARTFGRLDRASWLHAVALLADADDVHVLGLRGSAPVAALLARGLRARQFGACLVDELPRVTGVLVAVSVRRYAADTVRAVEYAKERGVPVVALTDNAASPLVEYAHAALFAEVTGVGGTRSLTALAALAQALAREVALRRGNSAPEDDLPQFGFYY